MSTHQHADDESNSAATTRTTTSPPTLLSAPVKGSNSAMDELSMSMHNASGRNKELWPTRMSNDEQNNLIVNLTKRTIDTLRRDSAFFERNPPRPLPNFEDTELHIGEVIGNGEFGMVFEVNGFKLPTGLELVANGGRGGGSSSLPVPSKDGPAGQQEFPTSLNNDEARCFMRENALREGVARFAVKRVRPDLTNEEKGTSAVDLAVEAKFLACIDHTNIIKLRATVSKPGHDSFMIVLDRLYSVLDKRIVTWKEQQKAARGMLGLRVVNKVEYFRGKTERLVALYDIARALKHLHSLKILYRDLKPENIGCDIRGDYKIFDFGLARELKRKDLREAPDGYDCTGLTGSRRWMAPEVALCKHYGLKADVYAYSLLFFHVMSLELPYHRYGRKKHMSKVAVGGERPDPKKLKSSPALSTAIVRGWDANPSRRPSMSDICDAIQVEVLDRKQNIKKNKRMSEVHGILRRSMLLKERSDLSLVREETPGEDS